MAPVAFLFWFYHSFVVIAVVFSRGWRRSTVIFIVASPMTAQRKPMATLRLVESIDG